MGKWDKYAEPTNKWDKYAEAETPATSEVDDSGLRSSFAQNAADSASFGFKDELQGGIGALLDAISSGSLEGIGENYRGLRDEYRGELDQVSEADPTGAVAGQIAGMLIPGTAAGKIAGKTAGGIRKLSQLESKLDPGKLAMLDKVKNLGTATGAGALEGMGSSEGDNMLMDTLRGAGGGALGGAAGEALGGVARVAGDKMQAGALRKLRKSLSNKASKSGVEDVLDLRMKEAAGHNLIKKSAQGERHNKAFELMGEAANKAGVKKTIKTQKGFLKVLRARGALPGSLSEAKTFLRDFKSMSPKRRKYFLDSMGVDISGVDITKMIKELSPASIVKEAVKKTASGAKETLSDLASFKPKKIAKHGKSLMAGAAASAISPLGLAAPFVSGAIKNVDTGDLGILSSLAKRKAGSGIESLGTIGRGKATALGMYGADATVQDTDERTQAFLDQQRSKKARDRIRK